MKPHRTDGVSLAFALIFLSIAAWWLTAQFADLTLPAIGWLIAGALILIGAFGFLGAFRRNRTTSAQPLTVGPVDSPGTDLPGQPGIAKTDPADSDQ